MFKYKKFISIIMTTVILFVLVSFKLNNVVKAENVNDQQIWSQINGGTNGLILWDGIKYSESITRNVYTLSANDVAGYVGSSRIESNDLKEMLSEDGSLSEELLFRTAISDNAGNSAVLSVAPSFTSFNSRNFNSEDNVRPVFRIDLSKTSYDIKTNGLPKKGDLINLNVTNEGGEKFRVLQIQRTTVELLAMKSINNVMFNNTSKTYSSKVSVPVEVDPSGEKVLELQQYKDSTLDKVLNVTYYNSLKQEIKSAIVPSNIVQDNYYWQNFATPDPGRRSTITITLNNGGNETSITAEKGIKFTNFPEDIEVRAWCKDTEFKDKIDSFNFIPSSDITLYAKTFDDPEDPINPQTNSSDSNSKHSKSAQTSDRNSNLLNILLIVLSLNISTIIYCQRKHR